MKTLGIIAVVVILWQPLSPIRHVTATILHTVANTIEP